MTPSRCRVYGARSRVPAHPRTLLASLALAVAASGCSNPAAQPGPGPLDSLYFPVGIATVGDRLLVASSNFDLAYGYDDGGAVVPVDLAPPADPVPGALRPQGGVHIPSLAGEIGVADAAACGLVSTLALVPVRAADAVMRITVAPDKSLSCGAGCELPLTNDHADPYGVGIVCRPADGAAPPTARAYVGYLRGPTAQGAVTQVDLPTGLTTTVPTGAGQPRSFAYDADTSRLFFTNVAAVLSAPLRWFELAGGCAIELPEHSGGCPLRSVDLWQWIRGVEPQGIALSNSQAGLSRRIYIAARLFDADVAASILARPGYDVGSVLVVLDLAEDGAGGLTVNFVRSFPLGMGASEVKVLPVRAGKRDVVAVTATGDGLVWIYDDEAGAMVKVFGRGADGIPELGRQPYGMAVRSLDASTARLFVASFGQGFVSAVDVLLADPGQAVAHGRIGGAP